MNLTISKLDQLPSNIKIVDSNGYPTNAFVFYLLKMFKKALTDNQNMAALLAEIDAVELGAGLNPSGTYVPDVTAHYINSATSLFDADILIDIALHNVQIELNTTQSGAGLNTDGTYTADATTHYLTSASSLKDADNLLDAKIKQSSDYIETLWSAGVKSGGVTTDNGDGTVAVSAGTAMIRTSASETAQLIEVSFSAYTSIALTDNTTNYIYVDYNSGSTILGVTTSLSGFNCLDKCLVSTITKEGTVLNIVDATDQNVDFNRKHRRMLLEVDPFRKVTGGGFLSSSLLSLQLSAGAYYYGLAKISFSAFDTSIAGTNVQNVFTYYYRNGSGGFTRVANSKNIDNALYDDGTGTLSAIGSNKYKVEYVYLINNSPSNLAVMYGQASYSNLANAMADVPPVTLPASITGVGVLLGRYIIKTADPSVTALENVASITYTSAIVQNHNDLSGIQGGTTNEYYHLTSAQSSALTPITGLSSTTPAMNGVGAVGTGTTVARADHVHPSDTSREPSITSGTTAQYWRGDKTWQTLDKTAVGLSAVENTALSTWAGSANITTLGTIGSGTWNATAIADGKIASALTGKTYNALTLSALATGWSISGGTTSKTLTINNTASISGTDGNVIYTEGAPVTKTGNYTVTASDVYIICNGTATITLTFPSAATYTGKTFTIKTIAAFTVVSASSNIVPINSATAGTAILAATAGKWAKLVSNGTNWVIMESN